MTLPEIDAEIARLTDEVNRLTALRKKRIRAQIKRDIERGLADPAIRAEFARVIADMERGIEGRDILLANGQILRRSPTSPDGLDWLARNNPSAGAVLILIYRERTTTRSPA